MISTDRQAVLAKQIVNELGQTFKLTSKDRALRVVKKSIEEFDQTLSDVDDVIKQKIASIKRGVLEGSSEWRALYDRFYQEEMNKK